MSASFPFIYHASCSSLSTSSLPLQKGVNNVQYNQIVQQSRFLTDFRTENSGSGTTVASKLYSFGYHCYPLSVLPACPWTCTDQRWEACRASRISNRPISAGGRWDSRSARMTGKPRNADEGERIDARCRSLKGWHAPPLAGLPQSGR